MNQCIIYYSLLLKYKFKSWLRINVQSLPFLGLPGSQMLKRNSELILHAFPTLTKSHPALQRQKPETRL